MYIINPESIKNKIKHKKKVAKYLINHNVPLLSKVGEDYYFADSESYHNALDNSPVWVKWAINLGQ